MEGETVLNVHKGFELDVSLLDYDNYNYKNAYVIHADLFYNMY